MPDELREMEVRAMEAWPGSDPPLSEHLCLEVAAAFHRGRPLDPGTPVPGCGCPNCTGIAADHPARQMRRPRRDLRPALDVGRARSVSVLEVARRLGCGDPVRRGRELHVRCPLHKDTDPSLRIHVDGRRWYCDPCGEGGDAIGLYMRARRLDFLGAVRELAA